MPYYDLSHKLGFNGGSVEPTIDKTVRKPSSSSIKRGNRQKLN